jgi:hypothetical protein
MLSDSQRNKLRIASARVRRLSAFPFFLYSINISKRRTALENRDKSRTRRVPKIKSGNGGALKMEYMILFTLHPDKAETPVPAELREEEFQKVRGLYTDGLVRQIWLRGDVRGACMIVEATSTDEATEKLNALPLVRTGFLQPPMIVPLKPYLGFAPRS